MKKEIVLIIWTIAVLIWNIIAFGSITYLVFFHGASGWWYLFGLLICSSDSYYKSMRKYFEVEE